MKLTGQLRKMSVEPAGIVKYALVLSEHRIPLNPYLGCYLQLRFTGNIYCIQCGRKTKHSFQQGYCYPCMQRLAECNFCIIHPEKCCVAQQGCPQHDWAHAQCAQPHVVYLANSSGLKVGITRLTQTPTRWMDQGACQALPIFQVANRYQSGIIEVCLKQFISDKTDWRKLLKQSAILLDLVVERDQLLTKAREFLAPVISGCAAGEVIYLSGDCMMQFEYPVQCYPEKIVSLSFDKTTEIGGHLQGIKGQYLLFDTGVVNIRKFSGYEIEFSLGRIS